MNTIIRWITYSASIALFLLCNTACSEKDEALTPSGITLAYTLPQGDHDYDNDIVDFYEKYGTYMLYQFTDKDTYWTPTGWKNGVVASMDEGGQEGYIVTPADESYVGQQIEMLQKLWFDSYSDKFLKEMLPVKIMLCSEVDSIYADYKWLDHSPWIEFVYVPAQVGAWYNYDNICISYGSQAVTLMSNEDKQRFKLKINRIFVESIMEERVSPTEAFEEMVNYTTAATLYSNEKCWALGTFYTNNASAETDWEYFMLMMVSYPEEYLTRTPENSYYDWDMTESTWEGILNPEKDTNGLLKKRYEMVRNYFIDNYNQDLQEIGNHLKD